MGSVYSDGWTHLNVAGLESFLTAWPAVLYGASCSLVAWMAAMVIGHAIRHRGWALPRGYGWDGLVSLCSPLGVTVDPHLTDAEGHGLAHHVEAHPSPTSDPQRRQRPRQSTNPSDPVSLTSPFSAWLA